MVGYVFGGDTGETPETLKRKREIIRQLMAASRSPSNVGEGLNALGSGIAAAILGGRADRAEKAGLSSAESDMSGILGGGAAAGGVATGGTATSSSGGKGTRGDDLAWADATPEQRAFLNTIAGPESGGRYNVIYGGDEFDDFSDHPRKAVRIQTGPNAGRTSSAAGKYQFLAPTWDETATEHGLADFSPGNQDKGAWYLAADAVGGEDKLNAILRSGDPQQIAQLGSSLRGIWTSLPGGIEQGTTEDKFVSTYQRYLAQGATPAQAEAAATQETGTPAPNAPVQVASLDPSAGVASAQPTIDPAVAAALQEQGIDPNGPQAQALSAAKTGPATASLGPTAPTTTDPVVKALAGQQEVAQADTWLGAGVGGGDFPAAPTAAVSPTSPSGGSQAVIQQLMKAAQNPWLNEGQQAIVKALLAKEIEKQDPAYQMGVEKSRLELNSLKNPKMSPAEKANYDLNVRKFGLEEANAILEREKFGVTKADTEADNKRADSELDIKQLEYLLKTEPDFYSKYVQQEEAAGRTPLGILDYAATLKKAGAQNTSVTVGGGENKQVFDEVKASANSARAAVTGYNALQEANKALDAGIISGAGADMRLGLQKIGALLGMDATQVQNTETFRSAIAPQVAAMLKSTVGSANISNSDREFAEKAAGGSITLDAGSIKRLLGIMEKASRTIIDRHRGVLDKVYPEGKGFDRERALFGIDALPEPAAPAAKTPPAAPPGVTPQEWNAMTPEEKALWAN